MTIRKDMEEWSASTLWPLSCYGHAKEEPCVPGLMEMSPEELRLLAYTANSAGASSAFLQNLEEMKEKQRGAIHMYANITTEEVSKMVS